MEVFQIIYLGDDEIEPGDQCGIIRLISDHGLQYLYNQRSVDSFQPSIKCGDQIMVTVDSPTIRSYDIDIEFDLFRGAYKGTIKVDWRSIGPGKPFLCEQKIISQDGTGDIAVLYGLFPFARVAYVQVMVLDDSVEDVYGIVAASNSELQRDLPSTASILFAVGADNFVSADLDPELPLSKDCVAVPLDAKLYVHLCLNCDGTYYKDKLCFEHQDADEPFQSQVDHSKKIQVKVFWGADRKSIISTYGKY